MIQILSFLNQRHFYYKATDQCCCADRSMETLPESQLRLWPFDLFYCFAFKLFLSVVFYIFQLTVSWLFHAAIFTRFLLSTHGTTSTQHSLNSNNSMVLCVKLIWPTNRWFLNVSDQQSDDTQPYQLIWLLISLQLAAANLCSYRYMEPVLGGLPLSRTQNMRHMWRLQEEEAAER